MQWLRELDLEFDFIQNRIDLHRFVTYLGKRTFTSFGTVVCEGGWLWSKSIDRRSSRRVTTKFVEVASTVAERCRTLPRHSTWRVVNNAEPSSASVETAFALTGAALRLELAFYMGKCPPLTIWTCVGCVSWKIAFPCRFLRTMVTYGRFFSRSLLVCRSR